MSGKSACQPPQAEAFLRRESKGKSMGKVKPRDGPSLFERIYSVAECEPRLYPLMESITWRIDRATVSDLVSEYHAVIRACGCIQQHQAFFGCRITYIFPSAAYGSDLLAAHRAQLVSSRNICM